MDLIYIAHPVRPLPGSTETVDSNLRDAEWWLLNLQRANPGVAFEMGWALELRLGVGDEAKPEDRRLGMARCRFKASRCAGIAICGPRIGSGSLAETHALGGNMIHRFRDRTQSLVLEAPRRHVIDEWNTPLWMHRLIYGSGPVSAEETQQELIAAFEAYADEVES